MIALEARHAVAGSDPKNSIRALMQRRDFRARQTVAVEITLELTSVEPEESVLRSNPKEPQAILHNGLNHQIGESFVLTVIFEEIALRIHPDAQGQ